MSACIQGAFHSIVAGSLDAHQLSPGLQVPQASLNANEACDDLGQPDARRDFREDLLPSVSDLKSASFQPQHAASSQPRPADVPPTWSPAAEEIAAREAAARTTATAGLLDNICHRAEEAITSSSMQPLSPINHLGAREAGPPSDPAHMHCNPQEVSENVASENMPSEHAASPSFTQGHAQFAEFLLPNRISSASSETHDVDESAPAADATECDQSAQEPQVAATPYHDADESAADESGNCIHPSPCAKSNLQSEAATKSLSSEVAHPSLIQPTNQPKSSASDIEQPRFVDMCSPKVDVASVGYADCEALPIFKTGACRKLSWRSTRRMKTLRKRGWTLKASLYSPAGPVAIFAPPAAAIPVEEGRATADVPATFNTSSMATSVRGEACLCSSCSAC